MWDENRPLHGLEEVGEMNRRALFQFFASAGIGASLPLDSIESLRGTLTRTTGVPDTLEDWQTVAAQYAATVPTTPPKQLLSDVLIDLAELSRLLDTGHPHREGLLAVSAQLSAYAAMALYDSGHRRTAFRWWAAARKTVDAAGHRPLQAWIRAREGADLLYGPQLPGPALQLANDAIRLSQHQASTGLAEAQTLRAVSLAKHGHPAARGALDDLARTVDSLPADVVTETTSWNSFGERRLRCAQATALLWLGDTAGARRAAERAIALHPPALTASAAQIQVSVIATCMVRDGDVTAGLEYAIHNLKGLGDLLLSVKDAGCILLEELPATAHNHPAARELRELIHT